MSEGGMSDHSASEGFQRQEIPESNIHSTHVSAIQVKEILLLCYFDLCVS